MAAANRSVKVNLEVGAADARKDIRATREDLGKLKDQAKSTGKSLDELAVEAKVAGRQLDDLADEARQADRELDDLAAGADKAGRATDKLGAKVRISGSNLRDMKNELGRLDRQIDATVAHLKLLEHQFAQTGDRSLLKQINADRRLIAQMQKIRGSLAPSGVSGGFLSGLPPMPVLIGGAAVLATALAPTIGAVVGGAVMGGVGTGGVIGGIAAAAHDGRVKDAWGDIGEGLSAAFRQVGQPFVGPLLHELNTFAVTAHRAADILHKAFGELAPVLRPLALGLDGFVEALGPGLSHAFAAARPALRAIANELPEIGAALTDMFDSISENGDGATMGLLAMLHAIEWLIRATGSFIGTMSGIFEWLVRTGNATTEFGLKVIDVAEAFSILGGPITMTAVDAARSHLTALNTETDHLISGLDKAKDPTKDFARDLGDTATSADDAAQKIKDLNDAIDTLFAKQMTWDEAQIRLRDGMRDLIEELTNGKRTLKENTIEGDKNRAAVLQQIGLIEDLRTAYFNQTNDLAGANAMYEENLDELQRVLIKRGYEKQIVLDIINAYRNLPKKAATTVETPGLTAAQSRLNKVEATLRRLDGSITTARFVTIYDNEYRKGERDLSRRWGGITEHAQTGLLRDAGVFSPSGPARYAFAEPATGGEAFIPRRGDMDRSRAIWSYVGQNWLGARAGGSSGVVDVSVAVVPTMAARDKLASLVSEMLRVDAGFRATVKQYVGA